MKKDTLKKEIKAARALVKKHPLLKKMWEDRERIFDQAHKEEAMIEAKYRKMAKNAGFKNVRFAYAESCFGIDVNDVYLNKTSIQEDRLLIPDFALSKDSSRRI